MFTQNKHGNDSLPQKADYDINEHLIVGKQKKWKKVIEWILTIIGWLIMFSYISYVIYGNLALKNGWKLFEFTIYNRAMLEEVNLYYIILLVVLLVAFVIFLIWKGYNRYKFGKLHRRDFSPGVSKEELMRRFELDEKTIEHFQNDKIITLEHNIIPEDLGRGKAVKDKK